MDGIFLKGFVIYKSYLILLFGNATTTYHLQFYNHKYLSYEAKGLRRFLCNLRTFDIQ